MAACGGDEISIRIGVSKHVAAAKEKPQQRHHQSVSAA